MLGIKRRGRADVDEQSGLEDEGVEIISDTIDPEPVRAATPGRAPIRFTPRSASVASALGTAAGVGAGIASPWAAAGAGAAVALVVGGQVGGRTIGDWFAMRRTYRKELEQCWLAPSDGVGIVWDGRTATVLIEIVPRSWQVTLVSGSGESEAPTLSTDVLRQMLVLYGIRLSRINVISEGMKFARDDHASGVVDTLIGPVSTPLGGRTVIEVSMDVDAGTLNTAYARTAVRPGDTATSPLPTGLRKTVKVAATHVRYALAGEGLGTKMLTAQQVRDFHDSVLYQVNRPLCDPRWNSCGDPDGIHTESFSPARGHWNTDSAASWSHLASYRQYMTLSLTPDGDDAAIARPLVTYLVRGKDLQAERFGLRRESGQQAAAVAQALPISFPRDLNTTSVSVDAHTKLGFGVPTGGAGMFVGTMADKSRVFIATPPASEPLWIAGPSLFAMQQVMRLSTLDGRIVVMIDDPVWEKLVQQRDSPMITFGDIRAAESGTVVCTPQWWEQNRSAVEGRAVILVTDTPSRTANHSLTIVQQGDRSVVEIRADERSLVVPWELTALEARALLDADAAAAREVSGSADDELLSTLHTGNVAADPEPAEQEPPVASPAELAAAAAAAAPLQPVPANPVFDPDERIAQIMREAEEIPSIPSTVPDSVPGPAADDSETMLLPRIDDEDPATTAQFPRISDDPDATTQFPRIEDDGPRGKHSSE